MANKFFKKLNKLYNIAGINKTAKDLPEDYRHFLSLPEYIYPPYNESNVSNELYKISENNLDDQFYNNLDNGNNSLLQTKYKQIIFVYRRIIYTRTIDGELEYAPYYHTCACKALKRSNPKYLAISSRHDGYFPIIIRGSGRPERTEVCWHQFCRYCYQILDSKLHLTKKGYNRYNFDISRFYNEEIRRNTFTPESFFKMDSLASSGELTTRYAIHWSRLSRQIKEYRNWTCQRCGFHASTNKEKKLIEVHHKDKNRTNNNPSNLEVLCRSCHTKEHPNRPQ